LFQRLLDPTTRSLFVRHFSSSFVAASMRGTSCIDLMAVAPLAMAVPDLYAARDALRNAELSAPAWDWSAARPLRLPQVCGSFLRSFLRPLPMHSVHCRVDHPAGRGYHLGAPRSPCGKVRVWLVMACGGQ
jgi:hypothetical protein